MIHFEIVEDTKKVLKQMTPEKMLADPRQHVHFMTLETFSKTFTPERIRLLKYLHAHEVGSISDLARRLKRKFEAIHRDLHHLERYDVVRVVSGSKVRIPKSAGRIEVRIV